MERYICIHGHFYQPPRENAWLEAVEIQDSAYPYHDWNERITAECYAPNSASRILDSEGRILGIVNNYSWISYNFGPTLLAWMKDEAAETYRHIIEADLISRERFSGHGSAMAQAYNHLIMPLANSRDKRTQVIWGIKDFQSRYGRDPEGMWLPECAVDLESLDLMAEYGIKFTVLAPYQAARVRPVGSEDWQDVTGGTLDPTRAYLQNLPSGRSIALFFYDGPISRGVAFENILSSGDLFAKRLAEAFDDERGWPQLVHIATDGETYGHYRHFGDMALAYALHDIEANHIATITNYGEYLEKHPPTYEVQIYENTSWSCSHGVERWRSNCGDNTGMHPGWNQEWRAPLRQALDTLRDALIPLYQDEARSFVYDPWAARDDYIEIILDRQPENISRYLNKHSTHTLSPEEEIRFLKLMEMQRHTMLMYTSCGWFFDEISGIETVQVLQYASRAMQLANDIFGIQMESAFLQKMGQAKSNIPEQRDGALVYQKLVKPAVADLPKVGAHYAISSLFSDGSEQQRIYSYNVDREDYHYLETGAVRMGVGRVRITSQVTRESDLLTYGVMHFGDQNLLAGVRRFRNEETYQSMVKELSEVFARVDFAESVRAMDRSFGTPTYTLRSLFRDQQRRIVDEILKATLLEAEAVYRQLFEYHGPLMHFLADSGVPLPGPLKGAAEFILNADLRRALSDQTLDSAHIENLIQQAKELGTNLDSAGLGLTLVRRMEQLARQWIASPENQDRLLHLHTQARIARSLPFDVDLREVQNIYYRLLQDTLPEFQKRVDEEARAWVQIFTSLGGELGVKV